MVWGQWSRADALGLTRYVTDEASRWLGLDRAVVRYDLEARAGQDAGARRRLVEALYGALLAKDIRYALEKYQPDDPLQSIRTPAEILEAPREGTCLDLAVLFCGLCLANELLPILLVTEGHALAAVSLTHGLREWQYRPERRLFTDALLSDPARLPELRELLHPGAEGFVAVECTGFARSEALGQIGGDPPPPESVGREQGVLPFERAVEAGRAQLEYPARPFRFAVDVAAARYELRIAPHRLEDAGSVSLSVIYQTFAKAPTPLAMQIRTREFSTLIDERTRGFVGREYVFEGVDERLQDEDFSSGYIVIRGEPGIGKTALMGQLVKQRDYVHHFNIGPQNIRSSRDFLANVCAQLIVRFGLDHPTLPPDATKDSGFLTQLLAEAAEAHRGQAVVVLVDALDEAEDPDSRDANRLYLPPALPRGVYFVVTTREQIDYRLNVDQRAEDIYLRDNDPQNLADVQRYIRNVLDEHRQQMAQRVAAWHVSGDEFVSEITERSQGNFMYLVHVLRDIRRGRLTAANVGSLRDLPSGLREYYRRHWRAMRIEDEERFKRYYEPVVCMLATAREPVTAEQVLEWVNAREPDDRRLGASDVQRAIEEWREFLNEEEDDAGGRTYRIYHASFQDFLDKEVGLKRYHDAIAENALAKIPGFFSGP